MKAMKLGGAVLLLVLVALCPLLSFAERVETAAERDDRLKLEAEVFAETLAAGRGARDEVGVRDQWGTSDHLNKKEDVRAGAPKLSAKVTRALKEYGIRCPKCTQDQAVKKINAYVKAKKREAAQGVTSINQSKIMRMVNKVMGWLQFIFLGLLCISLFGLGTVAIQILRRPSLADSIPVVGPKIGDFFFFLQNGAGKKRPIKDTARADYLRAKREEVGKARLEAEEAKERENASKKEVPTWRDNEEKEVWSAKQEKAFTKAMGEFQGVSGKEKWNLIAGKVDGKTRQECLMHSKLLDARKAEGGQGQSQGQAQGQGQGQGQGTGTARRRK